MNVTLTIQEKLKDLRTSKGLNLEQLAEQTGISRSALGQYETEEYKDISHTSIVALARFYGVSTDYLLGLTESKNHPNTDLTELHLSDGMIALLKSGHINTRLLCEMAAHKDFVKLLADIEIYVDGIAAMQIQSLNAYVNVAREMLEKKYNPSDSDRHMRILKAFHIDEDTYFANIVHSDIDEIMRDIKNAHRGDSTSAPQDDFIEEWKRDIEYASSVGGTPQKRQAVLYCRRLGIDYTKLTDVEFEVLIRVLQKSKKLKSPVKYRGKKR